jgi:hypothetical protein
VRAFEPFRGCFSRCVHRFTPLKGGVGVSDGDVFDGCKDGLGGYLPHTTLHTPSPSDERHVEDGARGVDDAVRSGMGLSFGA